MLLYYLRHVFGGYAGVPDVVGEHEDDRPLLVAAGAGVAQNGRRREPQTDDLFPEPLEELATTFGPAPTLPGRGADEDLSRYSHTYILCRARLVAIGFRLPAISHIVFLGPNARRPRRLYKALLEDTTVTPLTALLTTNN